MDEVHEIPANIAAIELDDGRRFTRRGDGQWEVQSAGHLGPFSVPVGELTMQVNLLEAAGVPLDDAVAWARTGQQLLSGDGRPVRDAQSRADDHRLRRDGGPQAATGGGEHPQGRRGREGERADRGADGPGRRGGRRRPTADDRPRRGRSDVERAATEVQLRELTPDYDQPRTGWDPVSIIGWAVIGVVYTAAVIGVVLWLR